MPLPKAGGGRGSLVEWLRSRGRHVVAAGCATGTAWLCGLGGGGGAAVRRRRWDHGTDEPN